MTVKDNQSVQSAEDGQQPHTVDEAVKAVEAEQAQPEPAIDIEKTSVDDLVNMDPAKLQALLEQNGDIDPGASTVEGGTPADTVNSGEPGATEGADSHGESKVAMIPKPRFDAVLTEKNNLAAENMKLREEKAFLAGVAAKTTTQADSQPQVAVDPIKEINDKIVEIDKTVEQEIEKVAKQFDNGDITLVDFEREKKKINQNARVLITGQINRRNKLLAERNKPTPEQIQAEIDNDPDLIAARSDLVKENPWITNTPDNVLDELAQLAQIRLVKQGVEIKQDVDTQWKISWTLAQIGKELGYATVYAEKPGTPAAPAPTVKTANNGYSPTPAQTSAKKQLATQTPPLPTMGGSTGPLKPGTDVNVEETSVDDLAKLPASTLQKMAGLI